MQYHDEDCATHKALKAVAFKKVEDLLTVYFEDVVGSGRSEG